MRRDAPVSSEAGRGEVATGGRDRSSRTNRRRKQDGDVARPNDRYFACAVRRRRFPVGESPTRRTLQPEATGAVMEVTKWLNPHAAFDAAGAGTWHGRNGVTLADERA